MLILVIYGQNDINIIIFNLKGLIKCINVAFPPHYDKKVLAKLNLKIPITYTSIAP